MAKDRSHLREDAESLEDRLEALRTALAGERAEAPALARELLALPLESWNERLQRDPRLHTWGLCELLLARSAEALQDPVEAGRLAALALHGAECLDPSQHPPPLVEDLKARIWAAIGGNCLRQGDVAAAERALRSAAARLSLGTGDLLVEAGLLEFEAAVRSRQGRRGEAAALLKMAADRYREIGDAPRQRRTLVARDEILRQGVRPRTLAPAAVGVAVF